MEDIVIDTNFLLIPAQFKVDIFSEIDRICHFGYSLCVLDKSINELEGISGKDKPAAKLALSLIKAKKLKIIKTNEKKSVDDLILDMNNVIVATLDKELIRKLKEKGTKIIRLRQKKYLVID